MRYFFLMYGLIYLSLLFYFLHRSFDLFRQKLIIRICGYAFSCAMIMLPFIHAWIIPQIHGVTGWLRLGFMFFCFMFLVAGITCDTLGLVFPKFMPYRKSVSYLLIAAALIYGIHEAKSLKLTRIDLTSPKLSGKQNMKIAFISDLHIGTMSSDSLIKKTLDLISSEKPDMLICGGDIMEDEPKNFTRIQTWFNAVSPPEGKYCVLGNHESYFGKNKSAEMINALGFTLLKNDTVKIKNSITLTGLDYHRRADKKTENRLLNAFPENTYNILLKHVPVLPDNMQEKTDLMLSGHTHNGQIFPFNFFVRMVHKYIYGLYRIDADSYIYVSSGSGYWEIPLRILSKPEVVIINVSAAA